MKISRRFALAFGLILVLISSFLGVSFANQESTSVTEYVVTFAIDPNHISLEDEKGVPHKDIVANFSNAIDHLQFSLEEKSFGDAIAVGIEDPSQGNVSTQVGRGSNGLPNIVVIDQSDSGWLTEERVHDYLTLMIEGTGGYVFQPLQLDNVVVRDIVMEPPNPTLYALLFSLGAGFVYALIILIFSSGRSYFVSGAKGK